MVVGVFSMAAIAGEDEASEAITSRRPAKQLMATKEVRETNKIVESVRQWLGEESRGEDRERKGGWTAECYPGR